MLNLVFENVECRFVFVFVFVCEKDKIDNNAGQAFPLFVVLAGWNLYCHRGQLDLQVSHIVSLLF